MILIDLVKHRYSVRKFSDREVPVEILKELLAAGRYAPTACNFQPVKMYVMRSAEGLEKIRRCTPCHFNAPAVIVFAYDRNVCWKRSYDGRLSGEIDAAIVMTHVMLQTAEIGLGSTWVGCFDPAKVSSELDLPENIIPVGLLPLGYPAEDAAPAEAHFQRKKEEDTVVWC